MANSSYKDFKNKNAFKKPEEKSTVVIEGLSRNSFVVDTRYISMKIVDDKGFQVGHYNLKNITGFILLDNLITLSTSDEVGIKYYFISSVDAELANDKLNDIINGI